MRSPFLLLAAAAVGALAACSSSDPGSGSTAVAGGGPSIVVEAPAGTGSSSASSSSHATGGAAASSTAQGGAAPGGSSSASGGGGLGVGSGAQGPGAAPGTYPVHVATSSSAENTSYDGPGSLAVASAAADGTQAQTVTEQGKSDGATTTYRYLPSGEVLILSIGGRSNAPSPGCQTTALTFSPPIEAVPATLTSGAKWSGSISGSGLSGSYSGSVTGQGTDTVGTTAVAIWKLHGSVDVSGKVCGYQFHATVTLDSDWAPSLHLAATSAQSTDATALGLHITGRSAAQLQSTTPS